MFIFIIISGIFFFFLYIGSFKYLVVIEISILFSIEFFVVVIVLIIWLNEFFGIY